MALGGNTNLGIRDGEVGVDSLRDGDALDGVTLRGIGSAERLVELHVRVERIVLGLHALLADAIIKRYGHLGLVGEELSQLEVGGEGVGAIVVGRPLLHALLKSAEAGRGVFALKVERSEVGKLDVEVALCCPAAVVGVFAQTELIEPHFTALVVSREVAHTDDDGLHLTQRRIAHHGHLVVGLVVVVGGVGLRVGSLAVGTGLVALAFQRGEGLERNIEHVVLGPYSLAVGGAVLVVVAGAVSFRGISYS